MSDDRKKRDARATAPRAVLRVVRDDREEVKAAADEPQSVPTKPQSRLGQFMSAYADAIDRDIKLLLDL